MIYTFSLSKGTQFQEYLEQVMLFFFFLRFPQENRRTLTPRQSPYGLNKIKEPKTQFKLSSFFKRTKSHPCSNIDMMIYRADRKACWYTTGLLVFLVFCVFVDAASSSNATLSESLDVVLHKHAFGALVHHQPPTGALYVAPLPTNLAGIQVAVLRLRSKTLWRKGANFSNFQIPPRTLSVPYVRRLLLVYQDLGNQSSHYYNITGYSLVSSVVGFTVYDASNFTMNNITKLDLTTAGTRISIQFPNLTFESGTNPKTSCAIFGADGKVSITERSLDNLCHTRNAGHFSIVTPLQRNENTKKIWVICTVLGFILLISGSFLGVVFVKTFKLKKTHRMERAASEGVILDTIWIHNSKMPCAIVTRTQPNLENADFP